jgi:predicted helicase
LTAALEPLVKEQRRARQFKSETSVVVCIGNPPYDRQERGDDDIMHERKGGWVRKAEQGRSLMDDFTEPLSEAGLGGHAKNLFNDYVYFWRWAMWKVFERHPLDLEVTGGIVNYISASSFIHGPAFAYFRKRLRELCDDIYVIDLGGQRRGSRRTANVFQQIKTPVAITIAVREPGDAQPRGGHVHYVDWSAGTRGEKLAQLAAVTSLAQIPFRDGPTGDTAPFRPTTAGPYHEWPLLTDLLPWQHSGVQVKRNWPIAPVNDVLKARWQAFVSAPTASRAALLASTDDRDLTSQRSRCSAARGRGCL